VPTQVTERYWSGTGVLKSQRAKWGQVSRSSPKGDRHFARVVQRSMTRALGCGRVGFVGAPHEVHDLDVGTCSSAASRGRWVGAHTALRRTPVVRRRLVTTVVIPASLQHRRNRVTRRPAARLRRTALQGPQRHRAQLQRRQAVARLATRYDKHAPVWRAAAVLKAIIGWLRTIGDTL